MATKDLKNNIAVDISLDPQAISSDTTTSGNTIDTKGYESVTIVFAGAVTDGTYTPVIKEGSSSTGNGATAVADADLLGTEALAALTTTQTESKVGYIGSERYVTVDIVSASTTTGATVGAVAVLGHPHVAPTA